MRRVCLLHRKAAEAAPHSKTQAKLKGEITATFWSAAVSCRSEGAPERTLPQAKSLAPNAANVGTSNKPAQGSNNAATEILMFPR